MVAWTTAVGVEVVRNIFEGRDAKFYCWVGYGVIRERVELGNSKIFKLSKLDK